MWWKNTKITALSGVVCLVSLRLVSRPTGNVAALTRITRFSPGKILVYVFVAQFCGAALGSCRTKQ
jgi:hypothetical protein